MLRCLYRAYSPVFLSHGLLEKRLNIHKGFYLRTSSVHLRSLKRGDSKVVKMSLNYLSSVCGDNFQLALEKIFSKQSLLRCVF